MNRREILIALGAGAFTGPSGSFAQQRGKIWRVGFLAQPPRPDSLGSHIYGGFPQGMRELGYIEGKNLVIEWRFADNKVERLPALADELVQLKVDVIVTAATSSTSAAQKATATIPVVMGSTLDPVGNGFVKSLAHPGGNITGISNLTTDIGPKHLEMLRSMVPQLSRVAVLVNPGNPGHAAILKSIQAAAERLSVTILPLETRVPQAIEGAFLEMAQRNAKAVIVVPDPVFSQQPRQIAELAMKHRITSIAASRQFSEAGVLMSYGPNYWESYRHAATLVDKIFKGARPGDLPVEQATKFELFINGKTAKALGLAIPQSLLISADKVIE